MTTVDLDLYAEALAQATDPDDVDALMAALLDDLEADHHAWLRYLFPAFFPYPFAPHHDDLWHWVWAIQPEKRCDPYTAIWSRGGAKSTNAEASCVAVGARGRRRYGLYVCGTQDQADDHVGNAGAMLESVRFGELYPGMADRLVGKFGQSRGWRRNRLRCASGFTLDAIGLDTAARGVKLEEQRPDFIVIDDLDDANDSPKVTERKIAALTRTILPAQAEHAVVLAVQNLVIPNGIFSRLAGTAEQPADFLQDRHVSGPIPAVEGLELGKDDQGRDVVLAGRPVWEGQGLERVQFQVWDWGRTAFLVEAQHEVQLRSGGIFHAWEWLDGHQGHGSWVDRPWLPQAAHVRRCRAWDTAGTEFDGHNDPDWTVGVKIAYDARAKRYLIEDVQRFRHASGTRNNLMRATALADAEAHGVDACPQLVEQRPGDLGRDEADHYVRVVFEGLRARKVTPSGTKPERADGLADAMENGLVDVVRSDEWTRRFLAELEGFPIGDHDDQVDGAAHAFTWLRKYASRPAGKATTSAGESL